jgi:hypothetical protein
MKTTTNGAVEITATLSTPAIVISIGLTTTTLSYPLTPAELHNDTLAEFDGVQCCAAKKDPDFTAALLHKKACEFEEAKLAFLLENKEACVICLG